MSKQLLQRVYYSGLSRSGLWAARLKRLRSENKAAILNLHRISPNGNPFWPPLRPGLFDELLGFLKNNFHVCTLAELRSAESDKPPAVLSFDDGYYDFIEHALPLLRKHGLRANMNVIPQCAISGNPIWNVRLYDFLNAASPAEINQLDISGFGGKLSDESPNSKLRFGLQLSRYLKNRPRSEREELWKSIEPHLDGRKPETRMMSTREIKQIAAETEIGVHSFGHESMGFESMEFCNTDLHKCQEFFRSELEIPLSIYAFPNGSYRPEQISALRQKGIEHILLVDEQFASASSEVLTRLTIYGNTPGEVKMKALGY